MKRRKGKGICIIGGGEIAGALLNAGVLDQIVVNVHPVILGKGIPLFPHIVRQIDLERLSCKPLGNGNVVLTFAVRKRRGKKKG